MDILTLERVSKRFGGLSVINDLCLAVPEHAVFGLIGKNGAGKTTTMKMILGFLKPDRGEIRVCGENVVFGNSNTNRFIGYLPDVPEFYGYMKPREYLRLCGEISGLSASMINKRTGELLELVGLSGVNRRIGSFSRGMKQRLGIAQALLSEPRLLICDEPTSALDPVGRKEILDILSVACQQTSIVFSTHILSDVERICDQIGILDGGRLVMEGRLSDIKNKYRHDRIGIVLADGESAGNLCGKLAALPFVKNAESAENAVMLRLSGGAEDGRSILEMLVREKVAVLKYEVLEPSLEDVFLEAVQ